MLRVFRCDLSCCTEKIRVRSVEQRLDFGWSPTPLFPKKLERHFLMNILKVALARVRNDVNALATRQQSFSKLREVHSCRPAERSYYPNKPSISTRIQAAINCD